MHLPVSVLTIVIGALLTAGGGQELVFEGILNSRLYPLVGGTLGAGRRSLPAVCWNCPFSQVRPDA